MHRENNQRRLFLKRAAAGGALALGFSGVAAGGQTSGIKKISLKKDDVILFQGDSITDAGRNRDETAANNARALGSGYALLAGSRLLEEHASKSLKIYNRGISGNKVFQLAERWDADCLNLKPTVLSILIGVNDFWHMINGRYDGTIETYRNDYRALLKRTKENLPDTKIIIGEPFAVAGVKAVDETWFPRFTEYRNAARELAGEFKASFVPFQDIFDRAAKVAPAAYWTYDGVHPSLAGSELMAESWLDMIS